ncbi:hypothetical protein R5W24_005826 [Gemmata sp. JC717]|uniref:Transposase n=1 Tax=Gemmata algarum TaxID=2975278 RepID=A0ABU5F8V3_9BACT|nr:hypothetical protein [Gemmata algarum]MDY3556656.1 hypothetical protein [Gemmata algarum]MDY3563543.1 hypothetical protein [Gemmata algarum]
MTRPCVHGRRFETSDVLRDQTAAWSHHTDGTQRVVDWQFRVDDARAKRASLYPKIKT